MKKSDLSKQRARAFDHLFDGVFVTDAQGGILDWNHSAELIYGFDREKVIGQPVVSILADENAERTLASVLDAVRIQGSWHGELAKHNNDGGTGWVETVVYTENGHNTGPRSLTWIGRDITQLVLSEKRMKALEYYDQLTNIPNRFLMYDRLQQLLVHSHRNGQMFALLFIDLDDFREVNLKAGQSAGDKVLQEVARRMQSVLRQSDTVARVGSDEFVILAGGLRNEQDAERIKDNIRAVFKGAVIVNEHAFVVSASIGLVIHPRDGDSSDELLIKADLAMEQEKTAYHKT